MEFDTLDEAVAQYNDSKNFYHRFGYVVWFAHVTHNDEIVRQWAGNSYW